MKRNAFTITEIMVTMIIVGVLATAGIVGLRGVYETQLANNAMNNLRGIHSQVQVHTARNGFTADGDPLAPNVGNLAAINTLLGTSLSDNDFTYMAGNDIVYATRGNEYFVVVLLGTTGTPDPLSGNNPWCEDNSGNCPTVQTTGLTDITAAGASARATAP